MEKKMNEPDLEKAVIEKLSEVIDPETGVDVMKMRLVQDINIDSEGKITYVFRPSSPLCPIAIPLALAIIDAIKEVPGISGQQITVKDYSQADQLNEILNTIV
jgi:metal-sulfur cluster biosynthetic enzyme